MRMNTIVLCSDVHCTHPSMLLTIASQYRLQHPSICITLIYMTSFVPLLKELAALMINLSYNPRVCEAMIANRGLNLLMDRFADKRDPMLMKIIRNISLWTFRQQQPKQAYQQPHDNDDERHDPEDDAPELVYKYRGLWSPHIKILIEIMLEENNHDLIVEVGNAFMFISTCDVEIVVSITSNMHIVIIILILILLVSLYCRSSVVSRT